MLRMRERLELPDPRCVPRGETRVRRERLGHRPGEPAALAGEALGRRPRLLADGDERRKIHLRGQVLPAGIGQQIGRGPMSLITAQRSSRASRQEELLGAQPVVEGQQPALVQGIHRVVPPSGCRRADLGGEAVRQGAKQSSGKTRP